jgi:hypothetical protein
MAQCWRLGPVQDDLAQRRLDVCDLVPGPAADFIWLKIDYLEDLKGYLFSIVIAVLAVLFLGQAVERPATSICSDWPRHWR